MLIMYDRKALDSLSVHLINMYHFQSNFNFQHIMRSHTDLDVCILQS